LGTFCKSQAPWHDERLGGPRHQEVNLRRQLQVAAEARPPAMGRASRTRPTASSRSRGVRSSRGIGCALRIAARGLGGGLKVIKGGSGASGSGER
jgi:hypothetical protein